MLGDFLALQNNKRIRVDATDVSATGSENDRDDYHGNLLNKDEQPTNETGIEKEANSVNVVPNHEIKRRILLCSESFVQNFPSSLSALAKEHNLRMFDTSKLDDIGVDVEMLPSSAIIMFFLTGEAEKTRSFVRSLITLSGKYDRLAIIFCVPRCGMTAPLSQQVGEITNVFLPENGFQPFVSTKYAAPSSISSIIADTISDEYRAADSSSLPSEALYGPDEDPFAKENTANQVQFMMDLAPSLGVKACLALLAQFGGLREVLNEAALGFPGDAVSKGDETIGTAFKDGKDQLRDALLHEF